MSERCGEPTITLDAMSSKARRNADNVSLSAVWPVCLIGLFQPPGDNQATAAKRTRPALADAPDFPAHYLLQQAPANPIQFFVIRSRVSVPANCSQAVRQDAHE